MVTCFDIWLHQATNNAIDTVNFLYKENKTTYPKNNYIKLKKMHTELLAVFCHKSGHDNILKQYNHIQKV